VTEKEIKFLTEKMKSCSTYLEYGSGNSTRIASSLENIKTITVVESSRDFWNELVESDTNIGCGLASGRVDVYSPYLGETINWGHFKGAEKSHLWPKSILISNTL